MALLTHAGKKFYIGPAAGATPADTIAEFEALAWVEIKGIANAPEYGDERVLVTSTELGDSRTRKGKGTADAGEMTLTCNVIPNDAGQIALIAAFAANGAFAFKVDRNDKLNATGANGLDFFYALVRSERLPGGDANAIQQQTFICPIDSQIYKKAATAGA